MQQEFLVESRSYDQMLRGSWKAYKLSEDEQLGDEKVDEGARDSIRLWLPPVLLCVGPPEHGPYVLIACNFSGRSAGTCSAPFTMIML